MLLLISVRFVLVTNTRLMALLTCIAIVIQFSRYLLLFLQIMTFFSLVLLWLLFFLQFDFFDFSIH